MKLILSTGNIVSGGPSVIRKPGTSRSNLELTNSLRSAFAAAKQSLYAAPVPSALDHDDTTALPLIDGAPSSSASSASSTSLTTPLHAWTESESGREDDADRAARKSRKDKTLFIPRVDWAAPESNSLHEPRAAYDLTLKLFFLPLAPVADRPAHAREALALVRRRLGLNPGTPIDLLILSFPGVSFEGDCDIAADRRNAEQGSLDEEVATWKALEQLGTSGEVRALGLAEFGSQKLARFLARVSVKPTVDQINIRDCCKVPPALAELGAKEAIELLVHSDCSDILPSGALRDLLGNGIRGAGVFADSATPGAGDDAVSPIVPVADGGGLLRGNITPLWVVKYTAFVKDRGVVENKGYFASAELDEA